MASGSRRSLEKFPLSKDPGAVLTVPGWAGKALAMPETDPVPKGPGTPENQQGNPRDNPQNKETMNSRQLKEETRRAHKRDRTLS